MQYAAIGKNCKKERKIFNIITKRQFSISYPEEVGMGWKAFCQFQYSKKIMRFVHVYLLGDLTEKHSFNFIESIWFLVPHKIYAIQNYMPTIWMKLCKYFNVANKAVSLSNKIQDKDLLSNILTWFPWNYNIKTFWNNLHRSMVIL